MAKDRIKLDHAGVAAILKSSEVSKVVDRYTEAIHTRASNHSAVVRHGLEVIVGGYQYDRYARSVTITGRLGRPVEAKHGVLTGAADAVGLEVHNSGQGR